MTSSFLARLSWWSHAALVCLVLTGVQVHELQGQALDPTEKDVEKSDTGTTGTKEEDLVTFNFKDLELDRVVETLIYQRDVNIVSPPDLTEKVTLRLSRVPWKQALSLVLGTHGYGYNQVGNVLIIQKLEKILGKTQTTEYTVRYMGRDAVESLLTGLLGSEDSFRILPQAAQGVGPPTYTIVVTAPQAQHDRLAKSLMAYKNPPKDRIMVVDGPFSDGTVYVRCRKVWIGSIVDELRARGGYNVVWETAPQGWVNLDLDRVPVRDAFDAILSSAGFSHELSGKTIRIGSGEGFQPRIRSKVFRLKYANAKTVRLLVFDRLSAQGSVSLYGDLTGSQSRQSGGTQGGAGGQQQQNASSQGGSSGGGSSGSVASQFRPDNVQTAATTQPPSNILIATDYPDVLEAIEKLIEEIDKPAEQIHIAVNLVEVTNTLAQDLGIQWNVNLAANGASASTVKFPFERQDTLEAGVTDAFTLGTLSATDFSARLAALASENKLRVLSSPNVSTISHQPASILIGQRFPITVETIERQTLLRTVTLDRFEEIGIQLTVVPRISGNNKINLSIAPQVSSVGQLIDGRFPVINTRQAATQLLIDNGATAVIGGLLEDRKNDIIQTVPGLSKIPLIGKLFSYRERDNSSAELLIFVTPRIQGVPITRHPVQRQVASRQVAPAGAEMTMEDYLMARDLAGKPGALPLRGPSTRFRLGEVPMNADPMAVAPGNR